MDHLLSIRVFQKIVETGSFTQAAMQLGLPRSSTSKAMIELEAHLGAKLLQRSTRAVTLTVEGAAYYQRMTRITAEIDAADDALRSMGSTAQGRLRIDVYSSFAHHVLIPALRYFKAECPDVQLAVGINDRPVHLIEDGVDCAIRAGELADSTMVGRTLYKDRLVTCASPSYLARHGTPERPQDLADHHQLIGYFGAATREVWPLILRNRHDEHRLSRFDLYANDSAGQIAMMAGGLGIGQTHAAVVQGLLASGALTAILPEWNGHAVPVSILYPSARRMNRRTRLFIDWLTRYLKQRVA